MDQVEPEYAFSHACKTDQKSLFAENGITCVKLNKNPIGSCQSTSRPPRIVGHMKKDDPCLLDVENWMRMRVEN